MEPKRKERRFFKDTGSGKATEEEAGWRCFTSKAINLKLTLLASDSDCVSSSPSWWHTRYVLGKLLRKPPYPPIPSLPHPAHPTRITHLWLHFPPCIVFPSLFYLILVNLFPPLGQLVHLADFPCKHYFLIDVNHWSNLHSMDLGGYSGRILQICVNKYTFINTYQKIEVRWLKLPFIWVH